MKRIRSFCLIPALLLCLCGCAFTDVIATSDYIGAPKETLAPVLIAERATPAPTPAPRELSYELQESLFRRDGVAATITGVRYVQNQSVTVTVSVENRTAQMLAFAARVPGAVNGWALPFSTDGLSDEDFSIIQPQTVEVLTLTTALNAASAEQMQLTDVQTLTFSFSGTLGERAFAPVSNIVTNPSCDPSFAPSFDGGEPLFQSARARYYYQGLDSVTATLFVSAECLGEPFDMTVIPCVNGYALGTGGVTAAFTAGGSRVMLAVPLLKTVQAFAIDPIRTLSLSVVAVQRGKDAGADTVPVPVGDAATSELPTTPAYLGAGWPIYETDAIQLYYESSEAEPSDYYGRITRFQLTCVNDSSATLYPSASLIKLAGAGMDGGFSGYIPPYSQTRLDFYVCANVNPGASVYLELLLRDGGAKFKRIAAEELTFVA